MAENSTEVKMINIEDVAMLLVDHQAGLFQTIGDMPMTALTRNVKALALAAHLAKIPLITTASMPDGPNGPLIPEVSSEAPWAKYVPRPGQINAWDCKEFVDAVAETGKKQLILAGTTTSVCMALPALSATRAGYTVFAVIDASGTYSREAMQITVARMAQAGVIPVDTSAILAELQKTWMRPDAEKWGELYCLVMPQYKLLIECAKKDK